MNRISKYLFLSLIVLVISGCQKKLVCPEDYELEGRYCVKQVIKSAETKVEYSCLSGYYLINGKCYSVNSINPVVPFGYTYCVAHNYYTKECTNYNTIYNCPANYQLIDNMCYPYVTVAIPNYIYTCDVDDENIGGLCIKKVKTMPTEKFSFFG